jgi:hypothetical protein
VPLRLRLVMELGGLVWEVCLRGGMVEGGREVALLILGLAKYSKVCCGDGFLFRGGGWPVRPCRSCTAREVEGVGIGEVFVGELE